MNKESEKYIVDYYNQNYNEDERFTQDKSHSIEYLTSIKYIDEYLKKGDRILEIGAGAGAYSLRYAKMGYKVDSIELAENNIKILKSKITDAMDITVNQGNALDLNMYENDTFDVTLVLGPMYHLFTKEDKIKALNEAKRVTKPGGMIFIAYLTSDSIFAKYGLHHLLETDSFTTENYKIKDIPSEIFSAFYIDEFNELASSVGINYIKSIAADGIAPIISNEVNELTDEEFDVWLDYHLKNCERIELQGYSSHMLYIGKK